MSAITFWVLMAFIPPGDGRPPAMLIERFITQAECEEKLTAFYPARRITFACLPSRQISSRPVPSIAGIRG